MDIDYDPAKDLANVAKHGVSLARVVDLDDIFYVPDDRFSEPRFRLYGLLGGRPYCAAVAIRDGVVRVISLRRAHLKEYRRHV